MKSPASQAISLRGVTQKEIQKVKRWVGVLQVTRDSDQLREPPGLDNAAGGGR